MKASRDICRGTALLAIAALAFLPAAKLPAFYESFFYLVFFWVSLSTSWALLSGFAGYFSLGHAAFFGIGMYTTATLTTKLGLPFLPTVPIAAVVAALLAAGIGAIVFRLRRLRGELLFELLNRGRRLFQPTNLADRLADLCIQRIQLLVLLQHANCFVGLAGLQQQLRGAEIGFRAVRTELQ